MTAVLWCLCAGGGGADVLGFALVVVLLVVLLVVFALLCCRWGAVASRIDAAGLSTHDGGRSPADHHPSLFSSRPRCVDGLRRHNE